MRGSFVLHRPYWTLLALVIAGCGGQESTSANDLTFDGYFNTFAYDYDPAGSADELAARSDVVVVGTLVDVIDGPIFGDTVDDQGASRFAVFRFESATNGASIDVMLPRPNTSRIDDIRPVMPLGTSAVLYLTSVATPPADEARFWFGLDEFQHLFVVTTPQGFIVEKPDGSGAIVMPIAGEADSLPGVEEGSADIYDWLPSTGELLPPSVIGS
jgi:hypothetical protein